MKAKKIVALCSGGFDSVLLANYLHDRNNRAEIHTLFFDYGQRSVNLEREKAQKVTGLIEGVFHEVKLPPIIWTQNNFYGSGYNSVESQYLEYRNLIFFSYALSLAQSLGAKVIYAAILKSHFGYTDTSRKFIADLDSLAKHSSKIRVKTPFAKFDKDDLYYSAYTYDMTPEDYHSCDTPIDGKPCGVCEDCLSTQGYEKYLKEQENIS